MTNKDAKMDEFGATLRIVQASIKNLENQVGQLARASGERPQGSLPSNTEAKPREHLKEISLRSGKTIEARTAQGPSAEMKREALQEGPNALQIVEALSQIPKYAKFLKDLLTNKRKLKEVDVVALNGNCSTILD